MFHERQGFAGVDHDGVVPRCRTSRAACRRRCAHGFLARHSTLLSGGAPNRIVPGRARSAQRASRIATVADSLANLVAHLPVHPSGPCRQRGYDATAGACYDGVRRLAGHGCGRRSAGRTARWPVCFPENPTVCYRPMPRRYGLGGVGGGNRNDRKSSTDCARVAAGWRTDVR
jgi:hypothetical protein